MDIIRNKIIEDIGESYAKFGHSQLLGRVVGLLICEEEPITVDQMCEILNISKSPVNQICRRLEELKLIRKVWVKGERKYHYEIVPSVFHQAVTNLMNMYDDSIHLIERNLRSLLEMYISEDEPQKGRLKIVCQRFIRMYELHVRFKQCYHDFSEEWLDIRDNLPTVEDYIEKMEIVSSEV